MMMTSTRSKWFLSLVCYASALQACAPASKPPPKEPEPAPQAYTPNFEYAVTPAADKLGITLGIVDPQFIEGGDLYWKANLDDEIVNQMLLAVKTTFGRIVIAKGFNTRGPFSSLNTMTYPDKQGSDLLLYPEFAFQVQLKTENQREVPVEQPEEKSGGLHLPNIFSSGSSSKKQNETGAAPKTETVCDIVLRVSGKVVFVAQEPLTGERMWIKDIDLHSAPQTFGSEKGVICTENRVNRSQAVKDAWAKAHESIFQASMKALDNYLNGQEFVMLNEDVKALREKKRF